MRPALFIAALATLIGAPAASGKELTGFALCGPDRCARADVSGLGHETPFGPPVKAPPPGRYVELTLLVDGAEAWRGFYVPAGAQIALPEGDGGVRWVAPAPKLGPLLAKAAGEVTPYPPPRITRVLVGTRAAADPASYLRLFSIDGGYADPGSDEPVPIEVETAVPTPWTGQRLQYYPGADVLVGGGRWLRLPPELAARLEEGRSLAAEPGDPLPGGTSAALGAGGAAGVAVLLAVVLRRRRSPGPPSPRRSTAPTRGGRSST